MLQTIPYNEEFEKAVIVAVLQDPQLYPKISGIVEPEDFYKERHREIFKVISQIEPDNLDSLTVQDKLRAETQDYFKELVQDSDKLLPSTSNAIFYAETVKSKSKLRAGIELGQHIIATCYQEQDADEALTNLEEMFATFLQRRVLEDSSETSTDTFKKFLESLRDRKADDPDAIKTGYTDLDLMTQRMEGLIILAARPSMGKTALALNIILNVLKQHHKVLFFSLEQDHNQVFERMLAAEAEVGLEEIRIGAFQNDPDSQSKVEAAEERLQNLFQNFHIDDRANVPNQYISSVSRQKKYEWGELGLIVVDYLHIMKLNNKQTVDALGDAVKELRALGKELGVPVLLLAQLRRMDDQKSNKRPELVDLRSSGEIEQSADMVWFIHRDSYYEQAGMAPDEDIAEVIVRKNRNGRQGFAELQWLPTIQKFKNLRQR